MRCRGRRRSWASVKRRSDTQSLQEDFDEAKEDLATSQRQNDHRYKSTRVRAEIVLNSCLRSARDDIFPSSGSARPYSNAPQQLRRLFSTQLTHIDLEIEQGNYIQASDLVLARQPNRHLHQHHHRLQQSRPGPQQRYRGLQQHNQGRQIAGE